MASNPRLRDAPQKGTEIQDDMGIEEDDDYEVEPPVGGDSISAMMPMSFGKQEKKRDLASGFAKTKRGTIHAEQRLTSKPENKELDAVVKSVKGDDDEDESSDDMIGPMPAEAESSEEQDSDSDEDDEFPVSHEIVLKDHTKVNILHTSSNSRLFQQSR
jgi:WD repeat-containing protein 70